MNDLAAFGPIQASGRLALLECSSVFEVFCSVVGRLVSVGDLTIVAADGRERSFGDGSGRPVRMIVNSPRTFLKLIVNPELYVGEAYMDGLIRFDQGNVYEFLRIVLRDSLTRKPPAWIRPLQFWRFMTRSVRQFNPASRARRNVAHHYDLSGELYDLFLDADRQYSCAYFESPDVSLEQAQLAKKRHIASKLALAPGQRVLDIGSGWGGLGLYLASVEDIRLVGVTLSEQQLEYSRIRSEKLGLKNKVEFRLQDYREIEEKFDRIVSVGMFEHVGVGHYNQFFSKVHELLVDDGVALVHSIGRSDGPGFTNPWIAKYIFPGGYAPAISEVIPSIERNSLWITDVEVLRNHYAETLRLWRKNFVRNWHKAQQVYDERFCRMWEFYLAGSEIAFRHEGMMNFQVQMSKQQLTLPMARDYMFNNENRLRQLDDPRGHDSKVHSKRRRGS
jgi:cyclopropane-fatty-acyl-phospholipid synthase